MTESLAALPMYDWPEIRADIDALWARIRAAMLSVGIEAPENLTRDYADLHTLWRAPSLLFAQACWGPMGQGLSAHVQLVGQPHYSDVEGGQGQFYRSAILMRRPAQDAPVTTGIEPEKLRGLRLAFNSTDSMSGYLALEADLEVHGSSLAIFANHIETGGHRASIEAVAHGRADICAVDCRSWALAQAHQPAAADLAPIAWTTLRKGLPYITGLRTSPQTLEKMRKALLDADLIIA